MSTDFNGSLMHTIHLLYLGVQKRIEHLLTEQGQISFSQFLILAGFTCTQDTTITQARLAEHLMLTEATVSRHIQTLVRMNFLTKKQDSFNKKAFNLSLTTIGKEKFLQAKMIVLRDLDEVFSPMTEHEKNNTLNQFIRVMRKVHEKR